MQLILAALIRWRVSKGRPHLSEKLGKEEEEEKEERREERKQAEGEKKREKKEKNVI